MLPIYNNKVLVNGKWVMTRWKNVKCGDVVRVTSNQLFPADLLFLSSR